MVPWFSVLLSLPAIPQNLELSPLVKLYTAMRLHVLYGTPYGGQLEIKQNKMARSTQPRIP